MEKDLNCGLHPEHNNTEKTDPCNRTVKCKFYFWGFCKLRPLKDKDNNCDYCRYENCEKFKTK